MTLDKAIELLNESYQSLKDHGFHDHADAVKLAIIALRRVKWHKTQHLEGYYEPLTGETLK